MMTPELEKRLDRIEKKLDAHLVQTVQNETDIKWIRGFIKISMTAIFTVISGLVVTLIKTMR